ncbi:MAG TPA: hypothetical protein DHN29_18760 [Cytophagales bacterium]|nr:hypothetical protein [Cytophagales bacterium]|tara:strand:- start:29 stop:535 length:507 start_codon:yes stop_codon:yes gene_type:complete
MEEIVNRVANSSLVSLDFDEFIDQSEQAFFDIKDGLFQGMILREKDFRTYIKEYDWSQYQGKNVGVYCSVDAIVPTWAYMLVATKLDGVANKMVFGQQAELEKELIDEAISQILQKELRDAKVVIKGCGNLQSRDYAFFELTKKLTPIVSSIMYGEPCSTVPVFKRKK